MSDVSDVERPPASDEKENDVTGNTGANDGATGFSSNTGLKLEDVADCSK